LEDLNVSGMMKNHKLSKVVGEASWSEFVRMLKYKSEWYGKNFLFIGRFDPSSKMCSDCGWIKPDLKLSDREWVCLKCGAEHDRDINAAKNIKNFSLQDQNLVYNENRAKKKSKSKKHSPADCGGEVPEMPVCKSGSMTEQSPMLGE
jgi:transposase